MVHSADTFSLQVFLALVFLVTGTWTEICSWEYQARPPLQLEGYLGERIAMKSQFNGPNQLRIRWDKTENDPFTGRITERTLVRYQRGNNSWTNNALTRVYSAYYRQENSVTSYELEIPRVTCDIQGLYSCHFVGTADCITRFNLTVVVAPSPPSILNGSKIWANSGDKVDIVCEAEVGNPPGEIWWYYIPPGGANIRRINRDIVSNSSESEECGGRIRSVLTVTLYSENQNGKYRCRVVGRNENFGSLLTEARVAIRGLEPTSLACQGLDCRNWASTTAISSSALVVHFLVLFLKAFVN